MSGTQAVGVERTGTQGNRAPDGLGDLPTATPAGHELTVRDERFMRGHNPPRWWVGNDPVATAWWNSVSASLPRGEAFFIDTLKRFREDLPPQLASEVRAFVKQEINHTREHVAFNRLTEAHGYDVESIDKGIHEMLALVDGAPVEVNLAITVALEHFAAEISHQLVSDPRYWKHADPDVVDLWNWHNIEEIEHKGLVFDVWTWATRDWTPWKRYSTRAVVALKITRKYFGNRIRDALGLLAQDGINGRRAKWRLYKYLWLSPGMMRRMFFQWARILLPGFHPWDHDNRTLIAKYDSPYAAAVMPAE